MVDHWELSVDIASLAIYSLLFLFFMLITVFVICKKDMRDKTILTMLIFLQAAALSK